MTYESEDLPSASMPTGVEFSHQPRGEATGAIMQTTTTSMDLSSRRAVPRRLETWGVRVAPACPGLVRTETMQQRTHQPHLIFLSALSLLVLPSVGCDDTSDDTSDDGLPIVGSYVDDYQTQHTVSDTAWEMVFDGGDLSRFTVLSYTNEAGFLIAQNDAANAFNPDLYSRFDWTFDDAGDLYFCQSAFDAMTAEDAEAASANASDLATGCGMFAWSKLTPAN